MSLYLKTWFHKFTMSKLEVGADEDTTWRKDDDDNGGLEPWMFWPEECILDDEDEPLFWPARFCCCVELEEERPSWFAWDCWWRLVAFCTSDPWPPAFAPNWWWPDNAPRLKLSVHENESGSWKWSALIYLWTEWVWNIKCPACVIALFGPQIQTFMTLVSKSGCLLLGDKVADCCIFCSCQTFTFTPLPWLFGSVGSELHWKTVLISTNGGENGSFWSRFEVSREQSKNAKMANYNIRAEADKLGAACWDKPIVCRGKGTGCPKFVFEKRRGSWGDGLCSDVPCVCAECCSPVHKSRKTIANFFGANIKRKVCSKSNVFSGIVRQKILFFSQKFQQLCF